MLIRDGIRSNKKMLRAGAEASWLWLCAIDYSRDQLLDGFVPAEALHTLGVFKSSPVKLAGRLCDVGLFDSVEGGFRVHDFLEFNDSADAVREKRARDAARKAARNVDGIELDSTRIPGGKKDARAGARERVGVGTGSGLGNGSGSGSPEPKEQDPPSRPIDPLGPSVWDLWHEVSEAHGYPQTAVAHGYNIRENVAKVRGLVRDDTELRAALDAWWSSRTPRADQRSLGHFAGHLPSVLQHIRSGQRGPWGETVPSMGARGSRTAGNAAAAAQVIAALQAQADREAS